MRFAFLLTQLEVGGAQTRVFQTATELRSRGHAVDVYVFYQARPCFEEEDKTILSRSKRPLHLLAGFARFWRHLVRQRYDVLITNTAPANVIGCSIAKLAGQRRTISWQTQPPQRLSKFVQRLDHMCGALGIYTATVANSHWTRACFEDRSAAYQRRMRLLTDGIKPRVDPRDKTAARRELGLDEHDRIVVTVGRLSRQKAHAVLVDAFRIVRDAQLLIVGEGELREDLERRIAALSLTDRVQLVGEVPGPVVATYLRATDCFAFPSRWETFGLAVVEAAASGVPLVTSNLDVLAEVLSLEDGAPASMMVPNEQADAWSDAINRVLDDQAVQKDLSERSVRVAQMHSIERHVDAIMDLVDSL
ncbi:MAG: glycosyltransferase family 4 protein [Devosiaceae bacterium]|nr:glycosyltransferase family 4 protein [Devosiaceae bacterium MH13]